MSDPLALGSFPPTPQTAPLTTTPSAALPVPARLPTRRVAPPGRCALSAAHGAAGSAAAPGAAARPGHGLPEEPGAGGWVCGGGGGGRRRVCGGRVPRMQAGWLNGLRRAMGPTLHALHAPLPSSNSDCPPHLPPPTPPPPPLTSPPPCLACPPPLAPPPQDTREAMLRWLGAALRSNAERAKMQPDPRRCASDGFMVNLAGVRCGVGGGVRVGCQRV